METINLASIKDGGTKKQALLQDLNALASLQAPTLPAIKKEKLEDHAVYRGLLNRVHQHCYADLDYSEQDGQYRKMSRIWAIGAIHADYQELKRLHKKLIKRLQPGDGIVYLGNYFGFGNKAYDCLQELLNFRIWFLSGTPYQETGKLVFLRGAQEETLARLLQLEYAEEPELILNWMEEHGMVPYIEGLGLSWSLLQIAARFSHETIGEWTKAARSHLYTLPGFYELIGDLKRAAFSMNARVALVNSGFDPNKPLQQQSDSLWWGWRKFENHEESVENFRLIVRGYDPLNRGLARGLYRLCVDGGAGRGGELYATLVSPKGVALQWL